MAQSTVRIDDPRISEAHALVSLRGTELKFLALRGRLSVDGKPRTEVTLTPGLRIVLAGFFGLTVHDVAMPDQILGITAVYDPTQVVGAHGVIAIVPSSEVPLRSGYDPAAAAHVWTRADASVLRRATSDPASPPGKSDFASAPVDTGLTPGDIFDVDGRRYLFGFVPRIAFDARPTDDRGRFESRLKLVLQFDTVHIHGTNGRSAVLDGIGARLLCELYEIGAPISWREVARLLWPSEILDSPSMRQRWDQLMTRVRMRLREAGIRSDLVRPTQRGLVELQLGPDDEVDDQT